MNEDKPKVTPLKLSKGQEIIIWEVTPPPPPIIVHHHRWAWTVAGHQECYDCGEKR